MTSAKKLLKSSLLEQQAYDLLKQRGVGVNDIADIVYNLQKVYIPDLTHDICLENIYAVMRKREVQNAVITGIEIDIGAEEGKFSPCLLIC